MRRRGLTVLVATLLITSACGDGGGAVDAALRPALTAADDMAAACADPGAWVEAADRFVDAAGAVAAEAEEVVFDAADLQRVVDRAVFSECDDATDVGPAEDALRRAGSVTAAIDDLHAKTSGDPVKTSSPFWYVSDHVAQLIELELLVAGGAPVDTIVLGSSVGLWGIDPGALAEATGSVAWNAAIGGLPPVGQPAWSAEIDARLDESPSVVVLAVAAFEILRNCSSFAADRFEDRAMVRAAAFADLSFLDAWPPAARLLGGVPVSYESLVLATSRIRLPEGERGRVDSTDQRVEPDPGSVAAMRADLGEPSPCPLPRDAVTELAGFWQDAGAEFIVAVMRTGDEVADFLPGGRAAITAVEADLRGLATQAGAGFVDLTGPVDQSHMRDFTHLNRTGRSLVTATLIDRVTGDG